MGNYLNANALYLHENGVKVIPRVNFTLVVCGKSQIAYYVNDRHISKLFNGNSQVI